MVRKYSPNMVFLMETRSKERYLKNICCKLDMENLFIVPRLNTKGGLALYWKKGLNLQVPNSSPTYIDAIVPRNG